MKVRGKQIAADIYGCVEDTIKDAEALEKKLGNLAARRGMQPLSSGLEKEEDGYMVFAACRLGHAVVHAFPEKGFVSADILTYSDIAAPSDMVRDLYKYLDADKLKITYLERGESARKVDMKPRRRSKTKAWSRMRNVTIQIGKLMLKPKSL